VTMLLRRVSPLLAVLTLCAQAGSKTSGNDGAQAKEIEEVHKLTLVQSTDGTGAVGIITCAPGFIDKETRKTEFGVPWGTVQSMTFSQLEARFCTERTDGLVIGPTPIGGGTNQGGGTSPGGGNASAGNFVQIDFAQCKSQENVDAPQLAEIKRVFVDTNDSFDKCVVFVDEFEKMIATFEGFKKAMVDGRVRIFASASFRNISFNEGEKKLNVPLSIKGRIGEFIPVAARILGGGSGGTVQIFPSNKRLVWRTKKGNGSSWQDAFNQCQAFGAGWSLPVLSQLQSVKTEFTPAKRQEMTGSSTGDVGCCVWTSGNNVFTNRDDFSSTSSGSFGDIANFCVLDIGDQQN
jgi:hypothetical protein